MFIRNLILFCVYIGLSCQLQSQNLHVTSPDEKIEVNVAIDEIIQFNVSMNGEKIIDNTPISLLTNGKDLGRSPNLTDQKVSDVNEKIVPVLPQKNKEITNAYRALQLTFEGNFSIEFRVYNEGFAYRFVTSMDGEVEIDNEIMDLHFPVGTRTHFPKEESMYSHFERAYIEKDVDEIENGEFGSLPTLFTSPQGKRIVFSDADLFDYPNAFIKGTENDHLALQFPKYVLAAIPAELGGDRNQTITERADYIAKTEGTRTFPWRMFALAEEDKDLLENEMVFKLSRPLELEETSWIKPGRVAWDWYNANNIWDVPFASGINNETYKYYIDFASKYGIEYVILDEGWTKSTTEILECNPEIDVKELVAYGKKRNVGIILWCLWKPLDENTDEILDLYASWGTKGIKVDFMQRADQYMVHSFKEIATKAAERKLLVDYHGAYKPAGLRRAYPNVISYEGVKGNENNKWSADITPTHNNTLPYIRNLVGPMDFTPGAMNNLHVENYYINFTRPAGMGTRSHQAAMYFIFESAIQMFCDTPTSYLKDGKTIEYLSQVPSVWDETYALDGQLGEYTLIARKKGDKYFIGAITNEEPRTLTVDFSFLPDGDFTAKIFKDGPNANKHAEDYQIVDMEVNNETNLEIKLARSGGWSAIVAKI